MRVFIISDMEGVAGITNWGGVDAKGPLYGEGRTLYTEEINAAVRGARAAGATEIVVMDCHGAGGDSSFNSLRPDLLDDGCEFVVQREWTEYTGVLEEGCDAALFVGMHAMAGSRGQMSHTVSGTQWRSVRFNGREVGETGINAALCGTWGCPVLLVTGDQVACAEASDLLGAGLTTVQVKTALGRFSARHKTPGVARTLIEAGAREALTNLAAVAPYDPGRPCEVRVELGTPDHTEQFRHHPTVETVDPRTVVSRGEDWWTAWRQFYFSYQWPDGE
jgi:D-amino peptidase